MLQQAEANKSLVGIRLLTILCMYVDDTILFCKVTNQTQSTIGQILDTYCYYAGQEINRQKSHMVFRIDTTLGKYLGVFVDDSRRNNGNLGELLD